VILGIDIGILAVGTPGSATSNALDLGPLFRAAEAVARAAAGPLLLVVKSTVPVGTGRQIRERVLKLSPHRIEVASNPEFQREGSAVHDFFHPDRIVLGADDDVSRALLLGLFRPLGDEGHAIFTMGVESAELAKITSNAMLATRLSFMNEIAALCERVGACIDDVKKVVGSAPRIGPSYLSVGPGYGGSCLPKDVLALAHLGRAHGCAMEVVEAADRANRLQRGVVLEKLQRRFRGELGSRRVALWGIAFKPDTDDLREAPSLPLIEGLLAAGADVAAYDPAALPRARERFDERVSFAGDAYSAVKGADALVLMTEWAEFAAPDWTLVQRRMKTPYVLDARNHYDARELTALGFVYEGIGRP
jgi:UDPglucose 6-dehydrogenase